MMTRMTKGCDAVTRVLAATLALLTIGAVVSCSDDDPPAARGALVMVGDSITACSVDEHRQAFERDGWDATVDAYPGRGLITSDDDDPATGVEAAERLRSAAGTPPRWVVALGTNDALRWPADRYRRLITEYLDALGPGARVMWVNDHMPSFADQSDAWNAALAAIDAERDDLVVFDWSAFVDEHHVPMKPDGVHYPDDQCGVRARAVADAATLTFAPPG